MDKNIILNNAKKELNVLVESVTLDNFELKKNDMLKYFIFLETLRDLPNLEEKIVGFNIENAIPESTEKVTERIKEAVVTVKDDESDIYVFERRVRGGIVLGLEDGYLVPEKLVRDIGLCHLDKIKAVKKTTGSGRKLFQNKRNHYQFEVVESSGQDLPHRVELRYCVVREDEEGVFVENSTGSVIEVDGVEARLFINERDVSQFELVDGDIVDVAYASIGEGYEETVRVISKETEVFEEDWLKKIEESPYVKKKVKDKEEKVKVERTYGVEDREQFVGKTLLVIGGVTRHPDFKKAIEDLGAYFVGSNGLEVRARMESMIKASDAVVISIHECSHAGSYQAVELAKKHAVPFKTADRNGIQKIVMSFEEAMNKQKQVELI